MLFCGIIALVKCMNFDLVLFRKVFMLIKPKILNATINRILQISRTDFVFSLYKNNEMFNLFISLNSNLAHFTLNHDKYSQTNLSDSFSDLLRTNLEGSLIQDFSMVEDERICWLTTTKVNEIGSVITRNIYFELTGRRTNAVLTKEDNIILDALYKYSYDEGAKRMIARGLIYQFPARFVMSGLPALLDKEWNFRQESIDAFIKEVEASDRVYLYQNVYHVIQLKHRNDPAKIYPVLEGINLFYGQIIQKNAIEEMRRPIEKIIKNEKARLAKRLAILEQSLVEANQSEKYKKMGDLIFTYGHDLKQKLSNLCVHDFETDQDVTIPLDTKYDVKQNANRFYAKYRKLQNSQVHTLEQIKLCQEEIDYFNELEVQLDNDLSRYDYDQMKQELSNLKHTSSDRKPKVSPKQKMVITKFAAPDKTIIYVGKNNIQNDYLSFHFANPSDTFFHVKGFPGSHVIVRGSDLSEEIIRLAAKIAAYYSKARYSSSIPVDYTSVANIKKIAHGPLGKVILKKQKTIYIDIDEDLKQYLTK